MIIAKGSLVSYENLTKNIIDWAKDSGNALAWLERSLTLDPEKLKDRQNGLNTQNLYKDDISESELNEGLKRVKAFCYANHFLDLYKEYVESIYKDNKDFLLTEYKNIKCEELKQIKEKKLSEMTFKEKVFQIDTQAKINISGKASEILLLKSINQAQSVANITWISKDNQSVNFTLEEFLTFATSVAKYTETITFKNDKLRSEVLEAKDKEAVDKVEWTD